MSTAASANLSGAASTKPPDLLAVRGQESARRALELAAAGGHPLLLAGQSGAGKTLLARCLPGLLPPLRADEAREVAAVWTRAGLAPPAGRPFVSPPPGLTPAGLRGGRSDRRPGVLALARHGVLLLEDLAGLSRATRETLCRALDEEPAGRCQLVATLRTGFCTCPETMVFLCRCPGGVAARYQEQLAALLDRIDLHAAVEEMGIRVCPATEGSAAIAPRVAAARRIQAARVAAARRIQAARCGPGVPALPLNAALGPLERERFCALDQGGRSLLEAARRRLLLTVRSLDRLLLVARTAADLAGEPHIRAAHLAEAIQCRSLASRVPD